MHQNHPNSAPKLRLTKGYICYLSDDDLKLKFFLFFFIFFFLFFLFFFFIWTLCPNNQNLVTTIAITSLFVEFPKNSAREYYSKPPSKICLS